MQPIVESDIFPATVSVTDVDLNLTESPSVNNTNTLRRPHSSACNPSPRISLPSVAVLILRFGHRTKLCNTEHAEIASPSPTASLVHRHSRERPRSRSSVRHVSSSSNKSVVQHGRREVLSVLSRLRRPFAPSAAQLGSWGGREVLARSHGARRFEDARYRRDTSLAKSASGGTVRRTTRYDSHRSWRRPALAALGLDSWTVRLECLDVRLFYLNSQAAR